MKPFVGNRFDRAQVTARKEAREKATSDIGSANSIPALRQRVDDIAAMLGLTSAESAGGQGQGQERK
ncbi:MAG: hypothetical protein WC977_03920 [Anaerovoracaceae bacterium]